MEEIAGEERRLVAARAGPHFQDRVTLVGDVLWQQRDADRLGHGFGLCPGDGELRARHRPHLRVEAGIRQHRLEVGALLLLGAESFDRRDHRLEVAEFPRERGIFGAADALGQARADFLVTAQDEIEIVVGGHVRTRKESGGRGRARAL